MTEEQFKQLVGKLDEVIFLLKRVPKIPLSQKEIEANLKRLFEAKKAARANDEKATNTTV